MKKENDICVVGNSIGGRQGWAYICNSMKYPILKVDMDTVSKDSYKKCGKVKVAYSRRGRESFAVGTLVLEKGKAKICGHGVMLTASFSYKDMIELIDNANAPVVHEGDIVALGEFSKEVSFANLQLVKIGKVDINCVVISDLVPLKDEEMQDVVKKANDWCNQF